MRQIRGTVTSQLWILYTSTEALHPHTHAHSQGTKNKKRSVGNVNNQLSILEYQMATRMTGSQSAHLLVWCKETGTTQSPFTARKQKTSFTCRTAAGPVSLCQKELINYTSEWSQKKNTATSKHWQILVSVYTNCQRFNGLIIPKGSCSKFDLSVWDSDQSNEKEKGAAFCLFLCL